jgi:hypothetical protein
MTDLQKTTVTPSQHSCINKVIWSIKTKHTSHGRRAHAVYTHKTRNYVYYGNMEIENKNIYLTNANSWT